MCESVNMSIARLVRRETYAGLCPETLVPLVDHAMLGDSGSEWVLVDLGDIVVHIMTPTIRVHYNLEELWVSDN